MIKDQNGEVDAISNKENSKVPNCCKHSCFLVAFVLLVLTIITFGKDYFITLLWWLDEQEDEFVGFIFILLYILVAFPFCGGYLILNLVSGYRFGILNGFILSMLGVVSGLFITYITFSHCCNNFFKSFLLTSEYSKAILSVLQKEPKNIKIIALARLTPVPYGLQNAVFSVSDVVMWKYVLASSIGLIPIQVINIYIGSTFRSMQGVLADSHTSTTAYVIFSIQVALGIALMVLVVRKARLHLKQTLEPHFDCSKVKDISINMDVVNHQ